jgi:hypothetical protein
MRAEEPIHDDPVIRKVAAARPPVPEDDLSPDGWRARAIEARVLSGSASVPAPRPPARWARPVRWIPTEGPALRERHRMRRGRWTGPLRSGVGFAVSVAIVIVIVVIASGSHAHRDVTTPATVHPVPGTAPPAPSSLLPAHGGMRGLVSTSQLVGSGSDLTASFYQCPQCRTRLHSGGTYWNSRSVDGGRTWRTERVSAAKMDLGVEAQAGDTVWATGELGNTPTFFVSHDDGHHYVAAVTAAAPASQSPLTISDGTVWALGNRCDGHTCRAVVLSGPVGGDRLTAAASQPALRPHVNGVQAVIGAHGSTVVITGGYVTTDLQTLVSHDQGHSWTRVSYPCQRPVEGDVYPTSVRSLWAVCLATRAPVRSGGHETHGTPQDVIRRSTDGGRHWTTTSTLAQEQPTLSAVTDHVAWITGIYGTVKRTTDGGRTWQTVLQVPAGADGNAELAVQDADTATIVVVASTGSVTDRRRRTDLVSYHTTDGGAHWTPTVIKLPTG